jgi:hypothetical protein
MIELNNRMRGERYDFEIKHFTKKEVQSYEHAAAQAMKKIDIVLDSNRKFETKEEEALAYNILQKLKRFVLEVTIDMQKINVYTKY